MPALTASDKQIKINKSMKTKNPLKAIKHQMMKLLKKRKSSSVDNKDIKSKSKRKRDLLVQIPSLSLTKNNSYTPSEPMALCNQLSESQSYPSDDHYARSSSDYMEGKHCHFNLSPFYGDVHNLPVFRQNILSMFI